MSTADLNAVDVGAVVKPATLLSENSAQTSSGAPSPVIPVTAVDEAPADLSTKRLVIDLTTGTSTVERSENLSLTEKLGGIGRSLKYIRDNVGRIEDPLSPENPLIINTGIFTGTKVMTGLRTYFTAFSPLKRSVNDDPGVMYSAASGNFGQELAFTGIQDVILRGACDKPSYLWIEGKDGEVKVELRDAKELEGLSMTKSVDWLKARHKDAHFAVIGPAGQSGVRYACVGCSTDRQTKKGGKFMRFAGRGGMGAVMGSKNLLGIAVQGHGGNPKTFAKEILTPLNVEIAKGDSTSKYRDQGTWRSNIEALTGPKGGLPINNFSRANHPDAKKLYTKAVAAEYDVTDENCFGCGIKCWKIVNTKAQIPIAKVDYEPLDLLGPNLGIFDIGQSAVLIALCDDLGLDAISMGGVIGYMMDNGMDGLAFGDFEGARRIIEDVAHGRNPFAALGTKAMSEQVGKKDNAIHVHGLELAAYLGNTDPAAVFAIAGNHMTMATYGLAINKGIMTVEGWLEAIPKVGLTTLLHDMTGVCKFAKVEAVNQARLLNTLGLPCSPAELNEAAIEVFRVAREIDKRQGFTAADDVLPERCFTQVPGQGVPQFNTKEFLEELKAKVYERLGI